MQEVWIGTSGWAYKQWGESFYPSDWPKKDQFDFYAQQFSTVEINATFYRLPTQKTVENWNQKAPNGFLYAVKGSRYITHLRKLKNLGNSVSLFFDRIRPLTLHLGPILWQLPPNLHKDLPRLEEFLEQLPRQFQHALEFRHSSWIEEDTFSMLQKYKVAHVWLSSQRMPMNFTVTAPFVYLRFHGLKDGAGHNYTRDELEPWAEQLINNAQARKPAFVYFNNDWNTRAPQNAHLLTEMVGEFAVQPFTPEEPVSVRPRPSTKAEFTEPRSKRLRQK